MLPHEFPYKIILASQSPRRKELLKMAGFQFEVQTKPVDESFPVHLIGGEVAAYIAEKKAKVFQDILKGAQVLITADTIVISEGQILGKPQNRQEAIDMLGLLSGKAHEVITGVCLKSEKKQKVFTETTKVFFKELSKKEIRYYVTTYQPYDKAGSYAIQEWIGMTGIEKIEGDYFNVVGLPVFRLYEQLSEFNKN